MPEPFRAEAAAEQNWLLDGERMTDPVGSTRWRCRDKFRVTIFLHGVSPIELVYRPVALRYPKRQWKRSPLQLSMNQDWAMLVIMIENAPLRL